jgi:uncharacterized protein YciI
MSANASPAETRPRETLFLLTCEDAPDSAELRALHMRGHLAHIERHIDRIMVAGPALDRNGTIHASVFVVRAGDEADARALLAADPYYRGGVWSQVAVRCFRGVCGTGMGGVTWESVL